MPARRPARCLRARPAPRHGFTLVELVVVLGILLVITSLGIGAFINTQRTNRLLGAANLVADLLRQARHTARTTGEPVLLRVVQEADGKEAIYGIARTPVVSTTFDEGPTVDGRRFLNFFSDPDDELRFRSVTGMTGHGLTIHQPQQASVGGLLPTAVLFDPNSSTETGLRERRLTRQGGQTDGFVLRCCVRITASANSGLIPLVVLTSEPVGPGQWPTLDQAAVALILTNHPVNFYTASGDVPRDNTGGSPYAPANAPRVIRGLLGLVRDASAPGQPGATTIVSAVEPTHAARAGRSITPASSTALTVVSAPEFTLSPFIGDGWHEIALVYLPAQSPSSPAGAVIELQIDGVAVAQVGGAPAMVSDPNDPLRIVVGGATLNSAVLAQQLGVPSAATWTPADQFIPSADAVIIDNLSLIRIGGGERHPLPPGITSDPQNPNLPILIRTNGVAGAATWTFRGINREQDSVARIQILPSGAIGELHISPVGN